MNSKTLQHFVSLLLMGNDREACLARSQLNRICRYEGALKVVHNEDVDPRFLVSPSMFLTYLFRFIHQLAIEHKVDSEHFLIQSDIVWPKEKFKDATWYFQVENQDEENPFQVFVQGTFSSEFIARIVCADDVRDFYLQKENFVYSFSERVTKRKQTKPIVYTKVK